jgi:glycosylphosphatidylinositol transamidase (GPIT) subunit GPI8
MYLSACLLFCASSLHSCRHQADVFHAYQVLVSGGYRPDHIVVMAYDDIANNPENPMPGKVFNRPGACIANLSPDSDWFDLGASLAGQGFQQVRCYALYRCS